MIDRTPVSKALMDLIAKATGRPCGLGQLPLVNGKPAEVPYTVLYPLGGSVGGAPLADSSEDAELVYQLTSVAGRGDQAEWMADRGRRAVLERGASGAWLFPLDVLGVDVWVRELDADDGIDASASVEGIVTSSQRYRLSASGSA
ncbi:hypothetical protein OG453_07195 [Streptomyces sp. NBC_01381]|uniref:hypothetical protein n=1 Tax=Streptomyces sp. NBC_01381 TaxID=2903845 RepID=UPI002259D052|nr:hypothetical protein [Streptomyces sp. NBC_01381]MCX4666453.1 hypothetical protein [Streptomyces sp. NBC_01381]